MTEIQVRQRTIRPPLRVRLRTRQAPTPLVRTRTRRDLMPLRGRYPLSQLEARIDKLTVNLTGNIAGYQAEGTEEPGGRANIGQYIRYLNGYEAQSPYKLFTQFRDRNAFWEASIAEYAVPQSLRGLENRENGEPFQMGSHPSGPVSRDGWTISGNIKVWPRRLSLELHLNPTRTAQHVLSRYSLDELDALPPHEFFLRSRSVQEATQAHTLDSSDNALIGLEGPNTHHLITRDLEWAEFLFLFEQKLKQLIAYELGCNDDPAPASIAVSNGHVLVSLNWSTLSVRSAEVYWERRIENAPAVARTFSHSTLRAVSGTSQQAYPQSVDRREREAECLATSIRLRQENLDLAVYAKTEERIRFEVRYRGGISRTINGRPETTHERFLWPFFPPLVHHASRAFDWGRLQDLLPPEDVLSPASQYATFADAVRRACDDVRRPEEFHGLIIHLLNREGLNPDRSPFGVDLIKALVRRQILIRGRVRHRDRTHTRRYSIHPQFSDLLERLRENDD